MSTVDLQKHLIRGRFRNELMRNMNKLFLTLGTVAVMFAAVGIDVPAQVVRKKSPHYEQEPQTQVETTLRRDVTTTSVTGVIRWKKEFGLPPTGPATTDASPLPCGLMLVVASRFDPKPFASSPYKTLATSLDNLRETKNLKAREEGDYYVCPYSITNLPTGVSFLVSGGFLDEHYYNIAWIGGTQSSSPQGYSRTFTRGRSVYLTEEQPGATVDFELVFEP